jgi:hypothetical protein
MITFPEFFQEWEMFQTDILEKIKAHILCSIYFSLKILLLWDKMEKKHGTERQATGNNMMWSREDAIYMQ